MNIENLKLKNGGENCFRETGSSFFDLKMDGVERSLVMNVYKIWEVRRYKGSFGFWTGFNNFGI